MAKKNFLKQNENDKRRKSKNIRKEKRTTESKNMGKCNRNSFSSWVF